MFNLFAFFGLLVTLFAGIFAVGLIIKWINNDDEYILPWLISTLAAAVSIAIHILNRI